MKEYIPIKREQPAVILGEDPTWGDASTILKDIIERFNLTTKIALEFGVATGHSLSALACYFDRVIGVDTFREDWNYVDPNRPSMFYDALRTLKGYNNIQLIPGIFEDFIKETIFDRYDIIHVDLIHTYEMTIMSGEWSLQHSDCVLFHDTISAPEVLRAVTDLSIKYNYEFYNYPEKYGLGILVKK